MNPTNQNKDIVIDESILDETPPNINEPQTTTDEPPTEEVVEETKEPEIKEEKVEPIKEEVETLEQKDQRYRAQQTEAQIQAAKSRDLINKIEEANKVGEPTTDEMKAYVRAMGADWDELTTFEQATARKTFIAEKKADLVNEAVESIKKVDEWASKVDTFIDETEDKPEYIKLSGHESDFRKFCMSDAHRGTPIDILLGSFLYNLPAPTKKRGSLFETGSGGEPAKTGKITDADTLAALRITDPREYKRQVKAGNVSLEV